MQLPNTMNILNRANTPPLQPVIKPIVTTYPPLNKNQVILSSPNIINTNQPQLSINPNTSVPPTPKFVPKLVPMPTVKSMPVQNYNDNNTHFVRNVNIYENGNKKVLTNVQGLALTQPLAQQANQINAGPIKLFVPIVNKTVVQRPMPVPVQMPVPVPMQVLMKKPVQPPVVPVPVAPVRQIGSNRPILNTLHQAVCYNPFTGLIRWRGIPTLETPNNQTYQQFIDEQIYKNPQDIANWNEPFQPRYQYVDEWGFRFTSNRPIYKDVKGNLVTLGNAINEPPL